MAGVTATLVGATRSLTTGEITFEFSDGSGQNYGSWEDAVAVADSIDSDPTFAKRLLIMAAIRSSPDGSNLQAQVGSMVAIDGNAATPVLFSLVE